MNIAQLKELLAGVPDHADVLVELATGDCGCGCAMEWVPVVTAERSNIRGTALALQIALESAPSMPILPDVKAGEQRDLALHLISRMQFDPRLAFLIGPGSQTFELLGEVAQDAGYADKFREMETCLKFERWPDTRELVEAIETLLGVSEESEYMSQKERENFAREALKAQAQR